MYSTKLIQNVAFAFFMGVISILWNNAFASTKTATFNCEGVVLTLTASSDSPIILGSIPQYKGTWTEVPSKDVQSVKLFNIDTEELAIVGLDRQGKTYLQIFKSVDAYHQHRPEHSSLCRI